MPIERAPQESLLERGVQRVNRTPSTVNRYAPTAPKHVNTDASDILGAFVRASGVGMDAVGTHLKTKIEEDKVRQMNNAFMGLQPSDDATKAGYRAHSVVGLQNEVLSETVRLKELAGRFEGNDSDWGEELVQSRNKIQESLFKRYPGLKEDPDTLTAITSMFNEQAPQLAAARVAGKLEQEHVKRQETFLSNIVMRASQLEGDELNKAVAAVVSDGRKALQLTQGETDAILVKAALAGAANGDGKLLEYTKAYTGSSKTSLFDRTGELQKADLVYKQQWTMRNQGALAKAKGDLINEYLDGKYSTEEFYAKAQQQNVATGHSAWTEEQMRGIVSKRQGALAKDTDISEYLDQALRAKYEGGEPVAISLGDTTKRKAVVAALEKRVNEGIEQQLKTLPEDQVTDEVRAQAKQAGRIELAELLAANNLVNEDWTNQFDSLLNLNMDTFEGLEEMPRNVKEIVELWHSLPEGSRLDHSDEKTAALMTNYELFQRQGMSPVQALTQAQKATKFKRSWSDKELKAIHSAAEDAADDIADGTWGNPFDNMPDWYAAKVSQEIKDATLANMRAGFVDPKAAARAAQGAFERYYTRLDNGQLMFGSRPVLAGQMKVHPDDIELTLDTYLRINQQALEDEANGVSIDNMYFDVVPHRGTVIVREGATGMPLTAPIPLDVLREGRDDFLEVRKAEHERYNRDFASGMPSIFGAGGKAESPRPDADSRASIVAGDRKGSAVQKIAEANLQSALIETTKAVENSVMAGFDRKTGVFTPHKSPEGGLPTIGYGHKLSRADVTRGYLSFNGKRYNFKEGDSQITEKVATELLKHDMKQAREHLKKMWAGFEQLPAQYQKVLEAIQYNAGDVSPSKWPKLKQAIASGNDAEIRKQMITSYRPDGKGEYVQLAERAERIADALGLDKATELANN